MSTFEEQPCFPIDTLNSFNKYLTFECLEKVCDGLVENAYLDGVIKHEGNKLYRLRNL